MMQSDVVLPPDHENVKMESWKCEITELLRIIPKVCNYYKCFQLFPEYTRLTVCDLITYTCNDRMRSKTGIHIEEELHKPRWNPYIPSFLVFFTSTSTYYLQKRFPTSCVSMGTIIHTGYIPTHDNWNFESDGKSQDWAENVNSYFEK